MYRTNNSKQQAKPVARNAPWPQGICFDFLQAENGLGTKTTYPSCSIPVRYRTVCLLLHEDQENGLQQGLVGVRSRGYYPEEYQTQALQFLNKPEDALINNPSTLLVHSVGQGMEDSPAQLHSVCSFRRCDQDPNQPEALHTPVGPARLCMEHTTLLEAKQLLSALTDQTSDRRRGYGRIPLPETPSSLEHEGASVGHIVAWSLVIIELLPPKVLLGRLLHWEQKTVARPWPQGESTWPDIVHGKLTDIESLDEVELFNESHWLFMKLTVIRLSSVEGNRRYFCSFYFLSECLRSIGLAAHLLNEAERATVRRLLKKQQYGMTVFLPPPAVRLTNLYRPEDVMNAKAVGFWKQQNLAHALPVGATDKFVHHCQMNALMMTHQPWQGNDTTGKEYIVNQKKKANEAIIPQPYALPATKDGATKGEATTVGIEGKLRRHVLTLLHSELRGLATGYEREKMVYKLVPDVLVPKLEDFLTRNNFGDWRTRSKTMAPLTALKIKQCSCSVISNFFTHFTHFFQDGHIAKHLADWQASNRALFVDSKDEIEETVALAKMLYSFYYLPARALLDQVDLSSNNKESRCPWIQFMRDTSFYSELSVLYAKSVQYILPDSRRVDVKTLCIILEHLIMNNVLMTRVDPRLAIKSKLTVNSDLGTRYYPRCSLHEFVPQFANPEEQTKSWFTLTDIAAGNVPWLNEKLVSHPYLKPIPTPPPLIAAVATVPGTSALKPPPSPAPTAAAAAPNSPPSPTAPAAAATPLPKPHGNSFPKPPPPAGLAAAVADFGSGPAVDSKPAAVVSPTPQPLGGYPGNRSEDDNKEDDYAGVVHHQANKDDMDDNEFPETDEVTQTAVDVSKGWDDDDKEDYCARQNYHESDDDDKEDELTETSAAVSEEYAAAKNLVAMAGETMEDAPTQQGNSTIGKSTNDETDGIVPPDGVLPDVNEEASQSNGKHKPTAGDETEAVVDPRLEQMDESSNNQDSGETTDEEEPKGTDNVAVVEQGTEQATQRMEEPSDEQDFGKTTDEEEQEGTPNVTGEDKAESMDSGNGADAEDSNGTTNVAGVDQAEPIESANGGKAPTPPKKRKRKTHVHPPNVRLRPVQQEMCAELHDFLGKYGDKAFMEVGREAFRQNTKTGAKKVLLHFCKKGRKKGR